MYLNDIECMLKERENLNDSIKKRRRGYLSINLPQCSAEFIIIHVGFGFSFPPSSCHFIGISELELTIGALPSNNVMIGGIRK